MEKKLPVFDAIIYGIKSVLDNFRLFFLINLIGSALLIGIVVFIGLVAMPVVKKFLAASITLWEATGSVDTFALAKLLFAREYFWEHPLLMITALLLGLLIGTGLYTCLYAVGLELYDTGTSTVERLFTYVYKVPVMLVGFILYLLVITIGFALLFIPGVYLAMRFNFFPFFMVDKNDGLIASFKNSWALTQGYVWPMSALALVQMIMGTLGGWMLLGLDASIFVVSWAYIYRYLSKPSMP